MTFAKINTDLPEKNAKSLLERRERVVPKGVSFGAPTFEGALVTDVDGNTFIDFAGAIGTINVGHCHPKVTQALKNQVDHYIHTGFNGHDVRALHWIGGKVGQTCSR